MPGLTPLTGGAVAGAQGQGTRVVSAETPGARAAATAVTLLRQLADGTALVRCRPETGRMHQIRAHLAHFGFPIANDAKCARRLTFLWGGRRADPTVVMG
jgi:23S rRNA pseudouridine1911/1915/1917 synthase